MPIRIPRLSRLLSTCVGVGLSAAAPVAGQTDTTGIPRLAASTVVRFENPSYSERPSRGTVLWQRGDSVALRVADLAELRIALSETRALDVSDGPARTRGAVVGAGVGVAVFSIAGAIHASLTKRTNEDGYLPQMRLGMLRGSAVGLPLGALVGALVRGERWRPVWRNNVPAGGSVF